MELEQYQLFPPLADEEYEALKADIKARGVQMPIVVDEQGNVLDGFHRIKACKELGISDYPRLICRNLTHEQKIEQALNLNLLRRHLTPEQRAGIVARLREEGWSTTRIAEKMNVSDETIRRDLSGSTIVEPDRVIGKDGKSYPAQRISSVITNSPQEAERVQRALALVDTVELEPGYNSPGELFKQERRANQERRITQLGEPSRLPQKQYDILLADPPWRYDFAQASSNEIENHYPTMELEDICLLDVPSLVGNKAVLFLWSTSPKLAEGMNVLAAWGFQYITCMVWVKDKIGMGYWARQQHELLLIGKRGDFPTPLPENRPASVIQAPRGAHSEKPEQVYGLIEAMYPTASRIELFSRKQRPGWDSWGLEAGNGPA